MKEDGSYPSGASSDPTAPYNQLWAEEKCAECGGDTIWCPRLEKNEYCPKCDVKEPTDDDLKCEECENRMARTATDESEAVVHYACPCGAKGAWDLIAGKWD